MQALKPIIYDYQYFIGYSSAVGFSIWNKSGFCFCFGLNPARIGGVAAGFDGELAHKAKHGETASETKSQPKEKGFLGFFWIFQIHKNIRSIRAIRVQKRNKKKIMKILVTIK